MNLFFDTSVLVPVYYADHKHHNASTPPYLSAGKEDFCALHSLAEVYSTLTGLPIRPRIKAAEGIFVINQIRDRLTAISLTEDEYVSTIKSAPPAIIGAAVYDLLIARCAVKVRATALITWNTRDFLRFGPDVAGLVKTPLEWSRMILTN